MPNDPGMKKKAKSPISNMTPAGSDPVAKSKDFLARTPAKPLAPPPPPEATGLRNMFSDLMMQVAEAEPIKTVLGIKDWLTRQNPGVEGLMPTTPEIVPGTTPMTDPTNHRLRLNQTFGKIPPR